MTNIAFPTRLDPKSTLFRFTTYEQYEEIQALAGDNEFWMLAIALQNPLLINIGALIYQQMYTITEIGESFYDDERPTDQEKLFTGLFNNLILPTAVSQCSTSIQLPPIWTAVPIISGVSYIYIPKYEEY